MTVFERFETKKGKVWKQSKVTLGPVPLFKLWNQILKNFNITHLASVGLESERNSAFTPLHHDTFFEKSRNFQTRIWNPPQFINSKTIKNSKPYLSLIINVDSRVRLKFSLIIFSYNKSLNFVIKVKNKRKMHIFRFIFGKSFTLCFQMDWKNYKNDFFCNFKFQKKFKIFFSIFISFEALKKVKYTYWMNISYSSCKETFL